MRIYLNGNPAVYMDVNDQQFELDWKPQGWTTVPVDPNAPEPPAPSSAPEGSLSTPDETGNEFLVRFTSDPTPGDDGTSQSLPWVYNRKDGTYRPFTSAQHFDEFAAANGLTPAEAMGAVTSLSPQDALDRWKGTFLPATYAPKVQDGKYWYPPYQGGNSAGTAVRDRYGMASNREMETMSLNTLSEILLPEWQEKGVISQDTINSLNDPATLAKYVSAMTYGGYFAADVWRDLKAKELSKSDPRYASLSGIDEEMTRSEYMNTSDWANAANDPNLQAPQAAFTGEEYLLGNYPAQTVADQFYADAKDNIDWNDPKFREEASKIAAGLYDVAMATLEANGAQEKAIADDNFNRFVEAVNKNYGLQLSNDVEQAWDQVEKLHQSMESRGLSGTGMENEARDLYLRDVRKGLKAMREEKGEKLDAQTQDWLLKSASPEQVAELVARMDREDQAKGIGPSQYRSARWGLRPSQDTLDAFSIENLRKKYPDYTDEQLRLLKATVIDDNGFYMSYDQRKLAGDKLNNVIGKQDYQRGKQEGIAQNDIDNQLSWTQADPMNPYVTPEDLSNGTVTESWQSSGTPGEDPRFTDEAIKKRYPGATEQTIPDLRRMMQREAGYVPPAPVVQKSAEPAHQPAGYTASPTGQLTRNPVAAAPSGVPQGYVKVSGPSQLQAGVSEWRDPNSHDIYQPPKQTASAVTAASNVSSGLSGAPKQTAPAQAAPAPTAPKAPDTSLMEITNQYGDTQKVYKSDYDNYWSTSSAGSWKPK